MPCPICHQRCSIAHFHWILWLAPHPSHVARSTPSLTMHCRSARPLFKLAWVASPGFKLSAWLRTHPEASKIVQVGLPESTDCSCAAQRGGPPRCGAAHWCTTMRRRAFSWALPTEASGRHIRLALWTAGVSEQQVQLEMASEAPALRPLCRRHCPKPSHAPSAPDMHLRGLDCLSELTSILVTSPPLALFGLPLFQLAPGKLARP